MNNKAISIGIAYFCSIFILWFNVIVPKVIHKRFAKDPYEAKYQYLIKIREKVGIDHHNDPRAYIEYSNITCLQNINYYNPDKENKY